MRAEIRMLHAGLKATSIYVTHDQVEAMTLADRIVAMHGGVIQQVGAPLELYDRPANLFVAGFIGSPGMNFLPGTWDAEARAVRLPDGTAGARRPDGRAFAQGSPVTLGIRPEHVRLDGEGTISAPVDLVEATGHGIVLHLTLQGEPFNVLTHDRAHLTRRARRPHPAAGAAPPLRRRRRPPRVARPARFTRRCALRPSRELA